MLQDGVRVSDIERYHNCRLSTIQVIKKRYQATETVKDRRRSGQPRIMTCSPATTMTGFFILWQYPFYVKTIGDEALCTNVTLPQLKLPASLSIKPGAIARSVAMLLGNQEALRSILASGTFFREDLVMKIFLRLFFLFR